MGGRGRVWVKNQRTSCGTPFTAPSIDDRMPCMQYRSRCELLRDTAQLLKFPFVASVTALVYLHRFVYATKATSVDVVRV